MQRVRSGMFVFVSTVSVITLLLFGNVFLTRAQPGSIPRVWSITPDVSTFSAETGTYTVTFSQAVTGVDATDFVVVNADTQIDEIEEITPTEFRITVTHITTDTPPPLVLVDDDSIINDAGVPLGGIGHANGNGVSSMPSVAVRAETISPNTAVVSNSASPHALAPRSTYRNVGEYPSIALTTNNVPIISYYDSSNQDMKLAICNSTNCSNPAISTIDATNEVGMFASLGLTSTNIPVIAYADADARRLKLAVCNDTACSRPTISIVDNTTDGVMYIDIAMTSNNKPLISYYDMVNSDLKLAICNNTACTNPSLVTLDSTDVVGLNTSIAVSTSNIPIISYHDATNSALKLAICNTTACTSPSLVTLDSEGFVGEYSSIALTSDNKPVISYFDGSNVYLKLAICNNAACTSPTLSTLDNTAGVGIYTSLALTSDNKPVVSYYDYRRGALKVAICDGTTCTSPSFASVDNIGLNGGYNSIAMNSDDSFIVSYYNKTNGNLNLYYERNVIDDGQPNSFDKSAPTNNQVVTTASTALTWDSSMYASGYEYCYATSVATCTTWISTDTATSATISDLVHNTTYYWQVRATNTSGTRFADESSYHRFTVVFPPASFAKSAPANNATNQKTSVTLSWAASTRATSYEYCIATSTAACTTWTSTGTTRSAAVTGLSKNKAYYWQVRAKNAGGTTLSNTSYWKFTTAP